MSETLALNEMKADMAYAKSRPFAEKNGCTGGVSQAAVMRMVQRYGPGVMTSDAKGFWQDQHRAYPWIKPNQKPPSGESLNGRRSRMGNVTWRRVRGAWERWSEEENRFVVDEKGPPSKMVYGE